MTEAFSFGTEKPRNGLALEGKDDFGAEEEEIIIEVEKQSIAIFALLLPYTSGCELSLFDKP